MRYKPPRTGWRCVEILRLMSRPDLLRPDPGVTNARPRQRLFSFRDGVLRDHQCIISTYLSLGTRSGPKEIYRTKTI